MRRNSTCLVLVLATSLAGCAQPPSGSRSSGSNRPEPSDSQLTLYYETYELFLKRTFPLESSAYLSVQVYKDMPSSTPEDLELSLSITRAFSSDPIRVRVLLADQVPVVYQVFELATNSRFSIADNILGNLRLLDRQLDFESCPVIKEIQEHWQPSWLSTPLPVPSEEQLVRLHSRVVNIAVRTDDREATLRTTDPDDPAFLWGVAAAREVRSCVLPTTPPAA
jgi:hypothetical protein